MGRWKFVARLGSILILAGVIMIIIADPQDRFSNISIVSYIMFGLGGISLLYAIVRKGQEEIRQAKAKQTCPMCHGQGTVKKDDSGA